MLTDAKAKGFPLKVAVIVSPYDLGAVPVLYKRPQTYAKFLGQEIYFVTKDELLVVMPNGYGIYKARGLPTADKTLVARPPEAGHDQRHGAPSGGPAGGAEAGGSARDHALGEQRVERRDVRVGRAG